MYNSWLISQKDQFKNICDTLSAVTRTPSPDQKNLKDSGIIDKNSSSDEIQSHSVTPTSEGGLERSPSGNIVGKKDHGSPRLRTTTKLDFSLNFSFTDRFFGADVTGFPWLIQLYTSLLNRDKYHSYQNSSTFRSRCYFSSDEVAILKVNHLLNSVSEHLLNRKDPNSPFNSKAFINGMIILTIF